MKYLSIFSKVNIVVLVILVGGCSMLNNKVINDNNCEYLSQYIDFPSPMMNCKYYIKKDRFSGVGPDISKIVFKISDVSKEVLHVWLNDKINMSSENVFEKISLDKEDLENFGILLTVKESKDIYSYLPYGGAASDDRVYMLLYNDETQLLIGYVMNKF